MPISKFKQITEKYPDITEANSECMVCLIGFEPEDDCRLTICFHLFHGQCLIAWLKRHENCPFCRYEINRTNLKDDKLRETLAASGYANKLKTLQKKEMGSNGGSVSVSHLEESKVGLMKIESLQTIQDNHSDSHQ